MDELGKTSWRDWYETVRISFLALKREVERVYCAGISLGALLGLKLALDEGWGVRALALMSTPLVLSWFSRFAVPFVRHTPLRWMVFQIPKNLKQSVADPEGRARYEEMSLPAIPARAVFELADLQRELLKNIHLVSNPILMLHALADCVAPVSNVELVRNLVASDIVEVALFHNSRHVITMDSEKDEVAKTVVDFFKKFV